MNRVLDPPRTARAASVPLLITAFVLVSFNLRIPFAGPGPLLPALDLSRSAATVLTALPALCMGIFASVGVLVRGRLGEERALFAAMAVLVVGLVVRSIGTTGLFAGTVIASAGVAVLNVITPVLVKKRFPGSRIGAMMGVYGLMISVGAALAAAVAVPVYRMTGSTELALGVALIPALLALIALIPQLGQPPAPGTVSSSWSWLLRNRLAWSVTGYFGLQSLLLYTVFAWLPSIYVARGVSQTTAGFYLSICALMLAVGGFVGPMLAGRHSSQRVHLAVAAALCFAGVLGILCAPVSTALLWLVVLGIGIGAGQTLPSMLYVLRTRDHHTAAALSTKAQTIGYLIGAAGPLLATALYSLSGSWTVPLVGLLVLMVCNIVIGLSAGRARYIERAAVPLP
ncbi:MFS transporter [Nocardia sp. CA-128927]|uniref:MFS transporter n=1 Tax=Nocardia sp. CA-128927 TaxID=3239975 RepID=UPI003D99B727